MVVNNYWCSWYLKLRNKKKGKLPWLFYKFFTSLEYSPSWAAARNNYLTISSQNVGSVFNFNIRERKNSCENLFLFAVTSTKEIARRICMIWKRWWLAKDSLLYLPSSLSLSLSNTPFDLLRDFGKEKGHMNRKDVDFKSCCTYRWPCISNQNQKWWT